MQLHAMARIPQHEPKHMSKNQRPGVQLQEGAHRVLMHCMHDLRGSTAHALLSTGT